MRAPLHSIVIRGLDPRIHPLRKNFFKGWIAGSSPAMTVRDMGSAR
jgi:hypothetical protein